MDFLRYRTTFARQREKVEGSRMKRSIGHQWPGHTVASRREPPFGTEHAEKLSECHPGEEVQRQDLRKGIRSRTIDRRFRLSATSLVPTAKVVRHTRRTA